MKRPIKRQRRIGPNKVSEIPLIPNKSVSYQHDNSQTRIALIQTGSWGDNINSTLMLEPLKLKYPESIIDVYTSTLYGSAFHNNPFVNNIIEYYADNKRDALHLSLLIPEDIKSKGYNKIFNPHPMHNPDKWTSVTYPQAETNLICAWMRALEDFGVDFKKPPTTILRLTNEEINKIDNYLSHVSGLDNNKAYLMEVSGESGQTQWNVDWTMAVGKYLLRNEGTHLFISCKTDGVTPELNRTSLGKAHFVGGLSIRECAELFNRCGAFFSVSSGLSNACNTDWCRKDSLWFEVTNSPVVTSAPIRSEGKVFYHDTDINRYLEILSSHGV